MRSEGPGEALWQELESLEDEAELESSNRSRTADLFRDVFVSSPVVERRGWAEALLPWCNADVWGMLAMFMSSVSLLLP